MENCSESEEEHGEDGTSYDFTEKTWRDDVTFIVEDQHLYASKTVLAMVSPVFEAMFGSRFKERDVEEVPLPGKSFQGFNEFLHCIYPKSQTKVDRKNVYKVLPLADEYNVKLLIKECKRFLSAHLINGQPPTQEVILCHGLAARHKFRNLRKVCATRLVDVGLEAVEDTVSGIHVGDTEILLQIHKDILRQQGEILEGTRTELVHLYLNKQIPCLLQPSTSEEKGSIIRFKPNINSQNEEGKVYSNPVKLWGIDFRVIIVVTKREDGDYLSIHLESLFPRNSHYSSCSVSAKFIFWKHPNTEENFCLMMKDSEFTDRRSWGFANFRKLTHLAADNLVENGTLDIVVYLLAKKPSVES